MSPAATASPVTTADRVAALADRTAVTEATRRLYCLRVVSSPEKPAPIYDISIDVGHECSATFAGSTSHMGEDDRGMPEVQRRKGNRQWLTDAEVATLKANIKNWIVRWQSREGGRAKVLNASLSTVILNPVTDEPLAPYLSIELASGE